ncbi:hypothetical protein BDQ17DRAFT_1300049 [Cyathus striatus]|nr:hypothetical protein BDQ17DRAFT_1300049 [Cyathus striatus]
MPHSDSPQHDSDRERDKDKDRDRDHDKGDRGERASSKQKAPAASSKTKDLSHVPCKFFKVGGCTAGASCPFSHAVAEPGSQKEPCAWFIKGNCKFGHKCALAHILPGQSMAMDRKNKKAAQQAAAASSVGEKGSKDSRGGKSKREGQGTGGSGGRNPLLAGGSTAPTRLLNSGGSGSGRSSLSMPLKASISPSAPAPPVKDTEFPSFAALDEMDGVRLDSAPAQGRTPSTQEPESDIASKTDDTDTTSEPTSKDGQEKSVSPTPLPTSAPRNVKTNPTNDFGPIGSPPGYHPSQPTSPSRLNRTFSSGTSPRGQPQLNGATLSTSPRASNNAGFLSSSPFSAPGTQTVFMGTSYTGGGALGVPASLGSGLAMMGGRKGWGDMPESPAGATGFGGLLSSSVRQSTHMGRPSGRREFDIGIDFEGFDGRRQMARGEDEAVVDEDLEDFIPSSLTDLLTPEERSRRMSRSNSGQPSIALNVTAHPVVGAESGTSIGSGMGHRHSRSVPAPSLLGDLKSIWADTTSNPLPASPAANANHRGTPSTSLSSRFESLNINGVNSGSEDMAMSMSMGSAGAASSFGMITPSNASAAFLPGLHHHYLNAKAKQAQQSQQAQLGVNGGLAARLRGTSGPILANNGTGLPSNSIASNYLQPLGGMNNAIGVHTHTHGNTQHTYRTTPSPFDLTQTLHQHPHTARPISSADRNELDDHMHMLSPSARALQAHAPGQSLPQGLAAGYSRIHALPPLASPGTPGTLVAGTSPSIGISLGGSGPYGDWQGASSPPTSSNTNLGLSGSVSSSTAGIDSMFSRLSYSAAATRATASTSSPPGLSRNASGSRYPANQPAGALSPLSKPVATNDDDELFSMDG